MEQGQSSCISTTGELTDLLCEFLEVAIQLLLSISNIYPSGSYDRFSIFDAGLVGMNFPFLGYYTGRVSEAVDIAEIFERRRHFNVPVQWIRHQELREYIHSAVTSLHPWILQGTVEKVAVVFIDSKRSILEKFVFKLNVNQTYSAALPINDIEYALRAFFIKLSVSQPLLRPLPADCSFEIVAYSKQLPGDASEKGQFWISPDSQQWQQPPQIMPIKSMASEALNVQLYIEHPSPAETVLAG